MGYFIKNVKNNIAMMLQKGTQKEWLLAEGFILDLKKRGEKKPCFLNSSQSTSLTNLFDGHQGPEAELAGKK